VEIQIFHFRASNLHRLVIKPRLIVTFDRLDKINLAKNHQYQLNRKN